MAYISENPRDPRDIKQNFTSKLMPLFMRHPNAKTRNQKPETRNQKPETRNQKPETSLTPSGSYSNPEIPRHYFWPHFYQLVFRG